MKKVFNNKLFIILFLFVLFLLINTKPTFASSVLVTSSEYNSSFIDDYIAVGQSPFDAFKKIVDYYHNRYPNKITISSSELPKYGLLVRTDEGIWDEDKEERVPAFNENYEYMFYFTEEPLIASSIQETSSVHLNLYFDVDLDYDPSYFNCRVTSGGLDFSSKGLTSGSGVFQVPIPTGYYALRRVVASTYDVYDFPDMEEVVFQQPTLRKATVLAPVIQKEREKGTLQIVLKEIILMIPLILVVVVSFLGLRKALKTLFQVLRRS